LVGVTTVGCRRCGGGLAGGVATSNVVEGARIASELDPELVVFDGSGAALPPVAADRTVAVVGGHQDPAVAAGYLNAYRLLRADIVVLTMADASSGWGEVGDAVKGVVRQGVEVVPARLRPRPLVDVSGLSIAYFSAAPQNAHERLRAQLESASGATVVHVSGNLANRAALRDELARIDADVFVVELKAAAIDVVAEVAHARGIEVVLAANDVVAIDGDGDLDERLLEVAKFQE
jgi:cyclic 2,3-diphosphoglycerate synthetase